MTPARFLAVRGPAWDRLDSLLSRMPRGNLNALTEAELHELTRLYPAVAVDVARARALRLDTRTLRRINSLAMRAQALLYRRERSNVVRSVGRFFATDYPRLFRALHRYVLVAALLFLAGFAGSYATVVLDPDTAYSFVPGALDEVDGQRGLSAADMSERFRRMPNAPLATGVMTNNISVAFTSFGAGITAGIGTAYVLLYNGAMLGGMAAHFSNAGLPFAFWSYVLGHGLLEVFAILIAAAAGLRLGLSLVLPGRLTRTASLRAAAREAALLVLGSVPFFVIAGLVEGFVTPSELAGSLKILLGAALLSLALAYLLGKGHRLRAALIRK
jgi:uncharacterized membrane protein SpoIIM required for sporulation